MVGPHTHEGAYTGPDGLMERQAMCGLRIPHRKRHTITIWFWCDPQWEMKLLVENKNQQGEPVHMSLDLLKCG